MKFSISRSSRARTIRVTVHADARVIVTAPRLLPEFLIQRFVARKAHWIEEKLDHFKKHPPGPKLKGTRRDYMKHKEAARALVYRKLQELNQPYGFTYGKVTIRNSKSRWGSCSKKGNLNFNYKLAFLSEKLVDYVIVHELCHLDEFNHSPRFWALVSKTIPNHKILRKELRSPSVV